MFDIGWSELLVIGVVLIVVVGPKDLPRMLRTFGRTTTQMRKMAGDFRKQFDEALREAELDEVREAARDLKALDPTKDIRKAMNPMKAVGEEIRSSLKAATKGPEPIVPSGTAAAVASVPPAVVAASGLEPSVIGTTEMQPAARMSSNWAGEGAPATDASAAPSAQPHLNGTGARANGPDASGEQK